MTCFIQLGWSVRLKPIDGHFQSFMSILDWTRKRVAHPLRYFAEKNPNMDRVYIFLPSNISGKFQRGIKFLCAINTVLIIKQ